MKKKFTFHPQRFNTTFEDIKKACQDVALDCTLSKATGLITVYYIATEHLVFVFWSIGVNQKIKTK